MLKRIGVASVAVLLMAAMAQAQPPGQGRGRGQGFGQGFGGIGRGGFGMGYGQLVGIEEVQTELKVTEDQKAALQKQADERRAAREQQGQGGGRGFGDFQNLTEEERNERIAQFRKEAAEREKTTREQIATVLDDAQMKRLREIWVQTLGVGALSNDEIVAELKITDLQKEEIADTQQEAFREMGEQMRELFQQRGQDQSDEDRQAARTKMDQLRKEAEEKVLANLNDEQKKQLETMKGAKFDLPQGAFGFGGRGGRGRPGGDGAGGDGGGRRRPDGDGGNNGGGNRPRRPDSV
jgi:hypothetical protein